MSLIDKLFINNLVNQDNYDTEYDDDENSDNSSDFFGTYDDSNKEPAKLIKKNKVVPKKIKSELFAIGANPEKN